jgi:hypothetical protein
LGIEGLAGEAGLYEEIVPLRAASMLKGIEEVALLALKVGGSTRRKGDELARRPLDRRPTRLCFGEPRLCEMGVRFVEVGTESDKALRLIAGDVAAGVVNRLNIGFADLKGVPSEPFVFFDGEARMLGSTFSESNSSMGSGENARLFDFISRGLPAGEVLSSWIEIARKYEHPGKIMGYRYRVYHFGGS